MDALELGQTSVPSSVSFHANVSEYIRHLIFSQAQPKSKWLMMQMTESASSTLCQEPMSCAHR